MNVVLWILQIVLAVIFLMAGMMKLTQTREKVSGQMKFVEDFSDNTIKLIGALEILAAIGLLLPPLFGVASWLAPLAAAGLAALMIGAMVVHARRGEMMNIGVNAVLLILALVVAWGRFGPESF